NENTLVNPNKKQWIQLVFCVIAGAMAPFFMYCYGTFGDSLIDKYGLTYSQYSSLGSVYAIAMGIGLFIVGALVNKLGCKTWTLIGIVMMIAGHGIFFFAPNYVVLLISRIISGLGNSCIYNAAYTLAVRWFTGTNKMGIATAGMTGADGIGTFFALFLFAMMMSALGNTNGTIATLVITTVLFIILCVVLKERSIEEEDVAANDQDWMYEKTWNSNTIAHSLIVSGVLGGLAIANYYGPLMMKDMGMAESASGFWSSMFTAIGIFSGFIFGGISDKMGKRKPTLAIAGIGMVIGYIIMVVANMMGSLVIFVAALLLIGFMGYVAYPIGFALISDTCKGKVVGPANGVIQGVSSLVGLFIFQQIVGIVKDMTDSYYAGLGVCAVLTALFNIVAVYVFVKDSADLKKKAQL
ncbi:MAG: nitrate/nitrite transporter, partial [Emergencia sp.]